MLGRLVIALAALVAAPVAMAQSNWRVMTEMGEGRNLVVVLIDTSSLTSPTSDTRTLMVATYNAVEDQTPDGKRFNILQLTYRFDCKAKTMQRIRSALFQDDVEVEGGPSNKPMIPVERNTLPGDLFEPACSGDFSRFPPITEATPAAERDRRFGKR